MILIRNPKIVYNAITNVMIAQIFQFVFPVKDSIGKFYLRIVLVKLLFMMMVFQVTASTVFTIAKRV
jgi:hypothetical protein